MSTNNPNETHIIDGLDESLQKLILREDLILNTTEDLLIAMERQGLSKSHIAKRLGKSKAYVSKTLDGTRNITLGTLSDFCFALNIRPSINIIKRREIQKRFVSSDNVNTNFSYEEVSLEPKKTKRRTDAKPFKLTVANNFHYEKKAA